SHAVWRRRRKSAEVLRLANGADEDDDLAVDAGSGESGLETSGEFGLPDAGKTRNVHRDARLPADGDQLDEVRELHGSEQCLDTGIPPESSSPDEFDFRRLHK